MYAGHWSINNIMPSPILVDVCFPVRRARGGGGSHEYWSHTLALPHVRTKFGSLGVFFALKIPRPPETGITPPPRLIQARSFDIRLLIFLQMSLVYQTVLLNPRLNSGTPTGLYLVMGSVLYAVCSEGFNCF
jgi:hypothetical protein